MKDLFLVLAGGLCAVLGSFFTTWYQSKKAQKIKMEQTIGEQKVEIYKKALRLISQLENYLWNYRWCGDMKHLRRAAEFVTQHEEWLFENEILLPHKFVESWLSIGNDLSAIEVQDEAQKEIRDLQKMSEFCQGLAKEAQKRIRDELGLPEIKLKYSPEVEQKLKGWL